MSCKPDLGLTCELWGFYREGRSCGELSKMFKISAQSVWERLRRRGLALRPDSKAKLQPFVEFDGLKYVPDAQGYFRCTTKREREPLHRRIWAKANGPIPRRHEVYFIDRDRMNVDLENLECVPIGERPRARPFKMKPCLACGRLMGKRVTGSSPESPYDYSRRKTCGPACSRDWLRGKPRGTKMAGNEHLRVEPRPARARAARPDEEGAARELERDFPRGPRQEHAYV